MNTPALVILKQYSSRKTRDQKDAFIALLRENYPELVMEECGPMKSSSLILGIWTRRSWYSAVATFFYRSKTYFPQAVANATKL